MAAIGICWNIFLTASQYSVPTETGKCKYVLYVPISSFPYRYLPALYILYLSCFQSGLNRVRPIVPIHLSILLDLKLWRNAKHYAFSGTCVSLCPFHLTGQLRMEIPIVFFVTPVMTQKHTQIMISIEGQVTRNRFFKNMFCKNTNPIDHLLLLYIYISGCIDVSSICVGYRIPRWGCDDSDVKRLCKKSCNLCDG